METVDTLYLVSCKGSVFNGGFACKAKAVVIKTYDAEIAGRNMVGVQFADEGGSLLSLIDNSYWESVQGETHTEQGDVCMLLRADSDGRSEALRPKSYAILILGLVWLPDVTIGQPGNKIYDTLDRDNEPAMERTFGFQYRAAEGTVSEWSQF